MDVGLPRESCGDGDRPFVHLFQTELHKYAYDVNSLRIVRLSELAAAVLRGWDDADDLIAEATVGEYSGGEVGDMRRRIVRADQGEGIFSCKRPASLKSPYDRRAVEDALQNRRGQLILCASEACNMRCKYCHYTYGSATCRTHGNRIMTWDVARKAIDSHLAHSEGTIEEYLAKAHVRASATGLVQPAPPPSFTFYGGEPLLNTDLVRKCVEYVRASRHGEHFYVAFTTNGTLLTEDVVDFAVSHDVKMNISFDGPRDLHDRYRRLADGSGTWDIVRNNLAMIRDRCPDYYYTKVSLVCVVAPPADQRIVLDFFTRSEIVCDLRVRFNNVSGGVPVEFWASLSEADSGIEGTDDLWREYVQLAMDRKLSDSPATERSKEESRRAELLRGIFDGLIVPIYTRTEQACEDGPPLGEIAYLSHGMCIPGTRRTFVTVDGVLLPCERVPDEAEAFQIGDVNSGFKVDRIMSLLEDTGAAVEDECSKCWNVRTCALSCGGVVGPDGRVSRDAMLAMCAGQKRSRNRALRAVTAMLEKDPGALEHLNNRWGLTAVR